MVAKWLKRTTVNRLDYSVVGSSPAHLNLKKTISVWLVLSLLIFNFYFLSFGITAYTFNFSIADYIGIFFFEFLFLLSLWYLVFFFKNFFNIYIYINIVVKFFFKMFIKVYYLLIRENFIKLKVTKAIVWRPIFKKTSYLGYYFSNSHK